MSPQYPKLTPKPAMVKPESPEDAKSKAHRRSRTGCFTCRLRRKKCDEHKPCCKACKKLGVDCEYSLPSWWTNPERRRKHRENIKNIIKITKMNERQPVTSSETPPSLYHSLTSSESHYPSLGPSRAPSLDSYCSSISVLGHPQDHHHFMLPHAPWMPDFPQFPSDSPYELDVRTDQEIFIDDMPFVKDSTVSTFGNYFETDVMDPLGQICTDNWGHQGLFDQQGEFCPDDANLFSHNFFDFTREPQDPNQQTIISVDDSDKHLLDHFLNQVTRLIFPMLEISQPNSAWADVILPAVESNKSYLHGCLSVAGLHLKATENISGEAINDDIMRHRLAAVEELCASFTKGAATTKILEAALAMIYFQSALGSSSRDALPEMPWHQQFQTAADLVQTLQLQAQESVPLRPSFQVALASWIDILGGTMLGTAPAFAQSYSAARLAETPYGLAHLTGCDDNVMYLISEVACLEGLIAQGYADEELEVICTHIADLGQQFDYTETQTLCPDVRSVFNESTGVMDAIQLQANVTAVFRMAARLYLCTLVPDFDRTQESIMTLLDAFVNAMTCIPGGPGGFDRCVVWPFLMAGSVSVESSSFRNMFAERVEAMGDEAGFGAFGRLRELFEEVWAINDAAALAIAAGDEEARLVHWRDAMRHKGWDFLLI